MNLAQQFLNAADRHPERIALLHGERQFTYRELADSTLAVSQALRSHHRLAAGSRVGLWIGNRPEFIPALLGSLHAGAVVVPINHFLKPPEVSHLLLDAGVDLVIVDPAVVPGETGLEPEGASGLRRLNVELFPTLPAAGRSASLSGGGDLALLIYTSGTTGQPKGAMLTHGNLLHNVESCRRVLEVVEFDRFVLMLPMFHSFMLTVCIFLPLLTGGSIVLVRSLHPLKALLGELFASQGTVLPAMAQVFRALSALPAGISLPLRLCISGAGPLPAEILRGFNARFPTIPLIEGYGLSEASPVVAVNPPRGPWIPGTIGLPIPEVEISIRDEAGMPVADLVDGEIWVRGGNVMRGYWNAPEHTAEALRDGWLLTGDIGHRRTDGYFVITDRKKDMLKPNGLNVYPREIEEAIYRFPGVREAAVVGEPDDRRGERPVAFVALDSGVPFDEPALLGFLKECLADYKLPRRAIHLPELPRNATGKILKTRLREMLVARPS